MRSDTQGGGVLKPRVGAFESFHIQFERRSKLTIATVLRQ